LVYTIGGQCNFNRRYVGNGKALKKIDKGMFYEYENKLVFVADHILYTSVYKRQNKSAKKHNATSRF